jgi:hypothetical protein
VRQRDAELERLKAALAAAKPEDAPSRTAVHKMQSELRQKDGRLRQLRAAIKALEAKLAELLQDKTDWWARGWGQAGGVLQGEQVGTSWLPGTSRVSLPPLDTPRNPLFRPAPHPSVMQASSWREQEMLDKRLAELEAQKARGQGGHGWGCQSRPPSAAAFCTWP